MDTTERLNTSKLMNRFVIDGEFYNLGPVHYRTGNVETRFVSDPANVSVIYWAWPSKDYRDRGDLQKDVGEIENRLAPLTNVANRDITSEWKKRGSSVENSVSCQVGNGFGDFNPGGLSLYINASNPTTKELRNYLELVERELPGKLIKFL